MYSGNEGSLPLQAGCWSVRVLLLVAPTSPRINVVTCLILPGRGLFGGNHRQILQTFPGGNLLRPEFGDNKPAL